MKKILIVVDYQNDFVDGALGFAGAEALEPGLYDAVTRQLQEGGYVMFTRDTHAPDYLDTREGAYLPVPHCIAGTPGHQLYGRLHQFEEQPSPHTAVLDKPSFGSPDIAAKVQALCGGAPDEISVCGVVTDICVIANTILLHSFFPKARVAVLQSLSGSGNKENETKALDILRGMGIHVE